MWSIEESMILMLTDSNLLQQAMDYWLDFYKRYIKAQKDAGAHAIWLGDCNAFSSMVSVEQYNEFIMPTCRNLVEHCEKELDIRIWLHNSEIKLPHIMSHKSLGVSFESIGPDANIAEIREGTRGRQAISGNLNPIEVLWRGTPELIRQEVERIMKICKPGGGYIFATGEMNPMQVPAENMKGLMDRSRELAEY